MNAKFGDLRGLAVAPDGTIYLADWDRGTIRRVTRDGLIHRVAGGPGTVRAWVDGADAATASLFPWSLAFGPDGALYVLDAFDYQLNRITFDGPTARIYRVAGGGTSPFQDGIDARSAGLYFSGSMVAVDRDGNAYFGLYAPQRVLVRVTPDGKMTTVAGGGTHDADGVMALDAAITFPGAIAIGPRGQVVYGDGNRIRQVDADGRVTTLAGNGTDVATGDGGPATLAGITFVADLSFGPDGSLYLSGSDRIRRIWPDGIITTVVGGVGLCDVAHLPCGDGGLAARALIWPNAQAVTPTGTLVFADTQGRVRQVRPADPAAADADETLVPSSDGDEVYVFDHAGRHLRTVDALTGSPIWRFSYDAEARLVGIFGPTGVTEIVRDASGVATAIVAPGGRRTALTIDDQGMLARADYPGGGTLALTYGAGGLLGTLIDLRGDTHAFTYDPLGRLIEDDGPDGRTTMLTRATTESGYTVTTTDALGGEVVYAVERLEDGGQRRTRTDPTGVTDTLVLRPDGTELRTAADGTVTTTTLGADPRWGFVLPIALGVTVTTPNGLSHTLTHTRTSATSSAHPLSLTTQTDTVTVDGSPWTQTFDAVTRTITMTSPEHRTVQEALDAEGRVVTVTRSGAAPLTSSFAAGRLAGIAQGSVALTFMYDAQGDLTGIADAAGDRVSAVYDAAGRTVGFGLPGGAPIALVRDEAGGLLSLTAPGGGVATLSYRGDDVATFRPAGAATAASLTRDERGSVDSARAVSGAMTTFDYDPAGRLLAAHAGNAALTRSYDAAGRLETLAGPDGTSALTYDGALVTAVTQTGVAPGTVAFTYDASHRLASTTVGDEAPFVFTTDRDGLLVTAGALHVARDASGRATQTTVGSIVTDFTFDARGEVASYDAHRADGAPLLSWSIDRDLGSRVTTRHEKVAGVATDWTYAYDPAGRLVGVSQDGVAIDTRPLDPNGNPAGPADQVVADRLLADAAATYTYDADGALTQRTTDLGATTYTRDAFGELVAVATPSATVTYAIGADGLRFAAYVDGVFREGYLYDHQRTLVATLDQAGAIRQRFTHLDEGGAPDLIRAGAKTYQVLRDHLGSPRLVVDTADGTIAQRLDYDAWGRVTHDTSPGFQPFGFAGGLADPDTGLVRFGVRDYDPRARRFTTPDPAGLGGRQTNLYEYVSSDPQTQRDPSGLLGVDALTQIAKYSGDALKVVKDVYEVVGPGGKGIPSPGGLLVGRAGTALVHAPTVANIARYGSVGLRVSAAGSALTAFQIGLFVGDTIVNPLLNAAVHRLTGSENLGALIYDSLLDPNRHRAPARRLFHGNLCPRGASSIGPK